MTVYIEYVIIDNFVIDCLLLSLTCKLLKMQRRRGRLLLCSALGAGLSLLYPVFSPYDVYTYLFRILGSIVITLPLTYKTTVKKSVVFIALFYLLTFACGGTIIAVYGMFSLNYSSEVSIGLMILPCYAFIKCVEKAVRKLLFERKENKNYVDCLFIRKGKSVKAKAYIDSGNFVKDANGSGVAICNTKVFVKIVGDDLFGLKDKIKITTVSGEKYMYITKADVLKIYYADKPNIFYNVTVGMGKTASNFDVLLGYGFSEDLYAETNKKTAVSDT